MATFRALLARLEPAVLSLNPYFETAGKTNGNFSRINRDIRFRADKSPYYTNYYLYFYDKRRARQSDGRLYVGFSAEGLTVGFSIYAQSKDGTLVRVFRPRLERGLQRLERWLARHISRPGLRLLLVPQRKEAAGQEQGPAPIRGRMDVHGGLGGAQSLEAFPSRAEQRQPSSPNRADLPAPVSALCLYFA